MRLLTVHRRKLREGKWTGGMTYSLVLLILVGRDLDCEAQNALNVQLGYLLFAVKE
jgi:hypothetical protein